MFWVFRNLTSYKQVYTWVDALVPDLWLCPTYNIFFMLFHWWWCLFQHVLILLANYSCPCTLVQVFFKALLTITRQSWLGSSHLYAHVLLWLTLWIINVCPVWLWIPWKQSVYFVFLAILVLLLSWQCLIPL